MLPTLLRVAPVALNFDTVLGVVLGQLHRAKLEGALFDGANMKDVARTDLELARAEDFVAAEKS